MSIRPIDFNGMIQNTAEVSANRAAEEHKRSLPIRRYVRMQNLASILFIKRKRQRNIPLILRAVAMVRIIMQTAKKRKRKSPIMDHNPMDLFV